MLMPKEFQKAHEIGFKNYLSNSLLERSIDSMFQFMVNKKGDLILVEIDIRIIPEVRKGVRLLCQVTPLDSKKLIPENLIAEGSKHVSFLIFEEDSSKIIGCSKQCKNELGIHLQ
jgi:hypothetical protein